MADFTYTTVPGKIKRLLAKIREVGVPTKASIRWLKSIGFTSSNDSGLLGVLKFIGFIDSASGPTEHWKNYRGADYKSVLAKAIVTGYTELFETYPNANERDSSDLESFFSTRSTAGKQAIAKTVTTFQKLCSEADFSAVAPEGPSAPEPGRAVGLPPAGAGVKGALQATPSLHIDVQVHISPEASPEQIDQIFASMAKHLYRK